MTSIRSSITLLTLAIGVALAEPGLAQWPGYPTGATMPVAYRQASARYGNGNANVYSQQQTIASNASTRMQALEAELVSLHRRIDQLGGNAASGCGCEADQGCGCASVGGCGCDEGGCCGCDSYQSGFYAGAEAVFAKPYYKESFEASLTNLTTSAQTLLPFRWDYKATPRVWFGYVDCDGLGARVRYWQFDQNGDTRNLAGSNNPTPTAQVVSVIFPATIVAPLGTNMTINNNLEFHTLDLEGTQQVYLDSTDLTLGAGLRYALLDQRYHASVTGTGHQLTWQRRFEGVGVTVSADARRPLGCSGLAAVGNFRGAMLFGHKDMNRTVTGNVTPNVGDGAVTLADGDDVFGGGELAIGLEWSRELSGGRNVFFRGMYEGQLWTDAGAPTLTFLGFEGFGISAGIHL